MVEGCCGLLVCSGGRLLWEIFGESETSLFNAVELLFEPL